MTKLAWTWFTTFPVSNNEYYSEWTGLRGGQFIEPLLITSGAPPERNVAGERFEVDKFRSDRVRKSLFEIARSINISSLRDDKALSRLDGHPDLLKPNLLP